MNVRTSIRQVLAYILGVISSSQIYLQQCSIFVVECSCIKFSFTWSLITQVTAAPRGAELFFPVPTRLRVVVTFSRLIAFVKSRIANAFLLSVKHHTLI